MADVKDVARYLLNMSKLSTPYSVTPRKLQKLLYFVQGYHLMYTEGTPLFDEDLIHRVGGPECESVREEYESYGWFTITHVTNVSNLSFKPHEVLIMDYVFRIFGEMDGKFLEELVFQEDPLLDTYVGDVITKESMLTYFREWYSDEMDEMKKRRK